MSNNNAIFDRIAGSNVFTKFYLKHSFRIIPLQKDSRDYTQFSVDGVLYRFKVVSFRLQNSCTKLMKALHSILIPHDEL